MLNVLTLPLGSYLYQVRGTTGPFVKRLLVWRFLTLRHDFATRQGQVTLMPYTPSVAAAAVGVRTQRRASRHKPGGSLPEMGLT